jgi:hypothetical protein
MLHPATSQIYLKHTPKHDTGGSNCQLIIKETNRTEGAEPNPSLHYKFTVYFATSLQESGQTAFDWDTNTRSPKHGGGRSARHMLHPTTSQIYVKHTSKQDMGGSNRQLVSTKTNNTEGAEPNPSLHCKLTEYSATKPQGSGQTAADWNTSTSDPKHGGERSERLTLIPTTSQISVKHTPK